MSVSNIVFANFKFLDSNIIFLGTDRYLSQNNKLNPWPQADHIINGVTTLHEGYTCSLKTIFWKKYSWHFLTHHKYLRSRKHQIILQGMVLCLRWSYTCAWKSSPGPFHHLMETTRIKFQADFSLLQNLYIQTYILHIVFISWKHQPLPRAETSDIQRRIWDLFASVM